MAVERGTWILLVEHSKQRNTQLQDLFAWHCCLYTIVAKLVQIVQNHVYYLAKGYGCFCLAWFDLNHREIMYVECEIKKTHHLLKSKSTIKC